MSVYPRADKIYVYDFWLKRVRFFGSTGCRSKREAKAFEEQKREAEKQRLKLVHDQRTGPLTVNAAFDRFWTEVGEHYTGTYRDLVFSSLAWMLEQIGPNTLIRDIGPNRVTELIARRRAPDKDGKRVTNATVNRSVTEVLRRILIRAGRKWQQKVQPIDWADLLLSEPKERVRELRDHEEAAVRAEYARRLRAGDRLQAGVRIPTAGNSGASLVAHRLQRQDSRGQRQGSTRPTLSR